MSYEYIIPALFLILSNLLKTGFITKKGVWETFYDFISGLPADLTFVAVSLVLISPEVVKKGHIFSAIVFLILAGVQLGFVYKGQLSLLDNKKIGQSFWVFLLNMLITILVFIGLYNLGV